MKSWLLPICSVMCGVMALVSVAAAAPVSVKSKTVDYKIGDETFEGLFVYPQAKGKVPGVLMVHNWLGVTDETKKQAERMAKLGLAVFAVDVYGKGIRAKGAQDAGRLAGTYKNDRKLFRARVLRGLEVLREQKEVDPTKIVAAGYCFGGTGVIELARAGADVAAVVSFHGGLDSPNPDDGKMDPGYNWCSGQAGIGGAQEFNPDVLLDPSRSLLIGYLVGNAKMFRCPADLRQGLYQGANPSLIGQIVPAARTFSMNQAVGTIDPGFAADYSSHSGAPKLPVTGPWLTGVWHQNLHNNPWRTFSKISDAGPPGPSDLWVLMDENASGLNDAAFAMEMVNPNWLDVPGTYHNIGCGFAFADGHSETHHWLNRSVKQKGDITDPKDIADWEWLAAHTSSAAQ